jgi:hypothetical protein
MSFVMKVAIEAIFVQFKSEAKENNSRLINSVNEKSV